MIIIKILCNSSFSLQCDYNVSSVTIHIYKSISINLHTQSNLDTCQKTHIIRNEPTSPFYQTKFPRSPLDGEKEKFPFSQQYHRQNGNAGGNLIWTAYLRAEAKAQQDFSLRGKIGVSTSLSQTRSQNDYKSGFRFVGYIFLV